MTVKELVEKLNLKVLVEGNMDREITGGYCGDLLSWVMGRAQAGDCWMTVMGNINAVAVAVLADTACIVLTENATLDDDAKARAEMQGVTILATEENSYTVAKKLGEIL
jgi:serine kinase of HPr protein (carbohydrate metabolism regulator)